jgi:hypothetical protein
MLIDQIHYFYFQAVVDYWLNFGQNVNDFDSTARHLPFRKLGMPLDQLAHIEWAKKAPLSYRTKRILAAAAGAMPHFRSRITKLTPR